MDRGVELGSPQGGLAWTQSPEPRGSVTFSGLAGRSMLNAPTTQEERMSKEIERAKVRVAAMMLEGPGVQAAAVHARLERLLSGPAR